MDVPTRRLKPLARQQRNLIREVSFSLVLFGLFSALVITRARTPVLVVAAAVSSVALFGAAFFLVRTHRIGIVWWLFLLELALGVAALLSLGSFLNPLVLFGLAGYTLHRALRLDEVTDLLHQLDDEPSHPSA
jgi:hypothetical protein